MGKPLSVNHIIDLVGQTGLNQFETSLSAIVNGLYFSVAKIKTLRFLEKLHSVSAMHFGL